jgi:hypothetical protein
LAENDTKNKTVSQRSSEVSLTDSFLYESWVQMDCP